ncbi:MAG: phasin family protein [Hyphomicrobium sp.]
MAQSDTVRKAAGPAWSFQKAGMLELYQPAVDGMTKYSSAMFDAYTAMGTEWLGFINRRLHVDLSLTAQLAKCTGPQDYLQEWAKFMKTAAEDYRNEFSRLAEMNTAISKQAATAFQANAGERPHFTWPGL